ncbi:MAG: hypothetical protein ACXADY_26905 [Candidatus Hodarchaeales archaeon]|jgi:hypothetical protein
MSIVTTLIRKIRRQKQIPDTIVDEFDPYRSSEIETIEKHCYRRSVGNVSLKRVCRGKESWWSLSYSKKTANGVIRWKSERYLNLNLAYGHYLIMCSALTK